METKEYLSDQELLNGLRDINDTVVRYLYKEYFPSIRYMVIQNEGTQEDAEDIFQESLYLILQRLRTDDFTLNSSFLSYLYATSKTVWSKHLLRKKFMEQNNELISKEIVSNRITDYDANSEKYDIFIKQFENLSEDCKKILHLFLGKMSLEEIAKEMGYKSVFYAKTKKYLCKEAFKKLIEQDPAITKFYNHERF